MNQLMAEFSVPPQLPLHRLADAICERLACSRGPETMLSRHFFDSFDWRLYGADVTLEWRLAESATTAAPHSADADNADAAAPMLYLRSLKGPTEAPVRQPSSASPGLLVEMPAGAVRDRLSKLLEMRRLLPMAEVDSQQTTLRLLNEDEKTVVWLTIERNRLRTRGRGADAELTPRLRLEPLRGYADAFERARRFVEHQLGLTGFDEPLALEAFAAAGRRPGSYSTKLDYRLDPRQRADLATKSIHLGLLETLEANVEGTRQNLDSEFLHDLRVATRRIRSALSQIKDVFPEDVVADFRQRFAWLQEVTGPMRDLDVYLLDLPLLEQRLPPSLRPELVPLQRLLTEHYSEVQLELAEALGSTRFQRLIRDWREFVGRSVLAEPALEADPSGLAVVQPRRAAQPIKRVADQRIRKMLKRVRAEGRAITDASAPEELHELRKSCKKLRYLLEFFQSLYAKRIVSEQIKQTKRLLDNLGRFQDTAVQAEHLHETADSSGCRRGGVPVGTLLAMGALIGQLLDEQARARAAFQKVFERFDSPENAARFDAMFTNNAVSQRQTGAAR
jgi:CHAD domain-containing protein